MDKTTVINSMETLAAARGLFIVDVKISRDNDITLTLESTEGSVTLDDCEALNRCFTDMFSQDEEDYSLTVTSAGLDAAFTCPQQFRKAIDSKVEVWMKGGRKLTGTLESFDDATLTLDGTSYDRKEINKVKYHIDF